MKVAYFTNQYPAISHTFIRREIAALEGQGVEIERYSVRRCPEQLVDRGDIAERERTKVILEGGYLSLLSTVIGVLITRPVRFFRAFRASVQMGLRSDRGLLRNAAYLAIACKLLRLLERDHCAHMHVHFGTNPTAIARLCRILGGPPYSFTVHGPEEFDKPWTLSLAEKIRDAAFVVAISSFGRSQLYRLCALDDWGKVKIVRCGVDPSYLDTDPPPIPEGSRVLVCVGRLCEQKGQLLLVQAAAKVSDAGGEFELVLVGDGDMRPEVEALIRDRGLEGRVRVTGWASNDEVRGYLSSARALVLPSFAEGLPVVIMEALALERPALTTYIAGIPELVEPDACGWLVPAGSVDALVDAMHQVLDTTPARLAELGAEGRRRVLASHDARSAVAPLLEAFQSDRRSDRR